MAYASLVPSLDADLHFIFCDFGRSGSAEADATTVVQNLLHGQYEGPLRVAGRLRGKSPLRSGMLPSTKAGSYPAERSLSSRPTSGA